MISRQAGRCVVLRVISMIEGCSEIPNYSILDNFKVVNQIENLRAGNVTPGTPRIIGGRKMAPSAAEALLAACMLLKCCSFL